MAFAASKIVAAGYNACAATTALIRTGDAPRWHKLQVCTSCRLTLDSKLVDTCSFHNLPRNQCGPFSLLTRRVKPRAAVPYAQGPSKNSQHTDDSSQQNGDKKAAAISGLRGIKAENTLVIAVFLKIIQLSSSGSIIAASLIQSGHGHSVGSLQGLSLLPVAVGLFLLTRYILKQRLHLRKGFAWGIFLGGVLLLGLSHRYSSLQRKYAEVPAPPVAQMAPRVRREERSGLRPLATAADADKIFAAYDEADTDLNRDWVKKKK